MAPGGLSTQKVWVVFLAATMGKNPSPRPSVLRRRGSHGREQRSGLFRSWSQLLTQGGQWRMLRLFSAAAASVAVNHCRVLAHLVLVMCKTFPWGQRHCENLGKPPPGLIALRGFVTPLCLFPVWHRCSVVSVSPEEQPHAALKEVSCNDTSGYQVPRETLTLEVSADTPLVLQ